MRAIAVLLIVSLTGCSFLMHEKRLKAPPKPGEEPDCDTNEVVPLVDLVLGVSGAAIGVGAVLSDTEGGQRVAMGAVGIIGVAFIAGWWYGRKWHNQCEEARRAYEDRVSDALVPVPERHGSVRIR
jgi:hypothetical protein